MVRRPAGDHFEVDDVIRRLRHAKARIVQCVEWARATDEVWRVLNEAPNLRRVIAASTCAEAAHIYERATRDAQIVMITRVLDKPSRGSALRTDRLSLLVCRDLMELPGVAEKLADEAKVWNELGDANAIQVNARLDQFRNSLRGLEEEVNPNRAQLIRSFRDENIAHELRLEERPERPLYRHIQELLAIVMDLTRDLAFVVEGDVIHWRQNAAARSASHLWEAVAAANRP